MGFNRRKLEAEQKVKEDAEATNRRATENCGGLVRVPGFASKQAPPSTFRVFEHLIAEIF
jgi:hypothetical protein